MDWEVKGKCKNIQLFKRNGKNMCSHKLLWYNCKLWCKWKLTSLHHRHVWHIHMCGYHLRLGSFLTMGLIEGHSKFKHKDWTQWLTLTLGPIGFWWCKAMGKKNSVSTCVYQNRHFILGGARQKKRSSTTYPHIHNLKKVPSASYQGSFSPLHASRVV